MTTRFAHVEILGPRASLDEWLTVLQDHGGCHLVDALQGLEGESGIGRPLPSANEREGGTLRSAAAHRLRAVERILPGSAADEDPTDRPAFSVGQGGEGRVDLESACAVASAVAERLTAALEAGRRADRRLREAEDVRLAVAAFRGRGWDDLDGLAFSWPLDAIGVRGIQRRLRRLGADVGKADGSRQVVLALRSDAAARSGLHEAAHAVGGHEVVWPQAILDAPSRAGELAEADAHQAREADQVALGALREAIEQEGPQARALLDALEDAEAREALHRRLASSEHVAAARSYVRREDLPALERALDMRFGKDVVLRHLAPGGDEPSMPRALAGLPFTALAGLRPSAFGSVSVASLLALAVPPALGVAFADLGAGLLMLFIGGLLGIGAAAGSPRRDTSLLAQISGVVALVLGILVGRAFGELGASLFDTSWGLVPSLGLGGVAAVRVFAGVIAGAAALFTLWGGVTWLRHTGAGHPARARMAGIGALHLLVVTGGAAALAWPPSEVLHAAWWLVPLGGVVVFLVAGGRGFGRLLLDLVGVVRLAAVAFLALAAFAWATSTLVAPPGVWAWVLAPLAVFVTLLAALVDPAHVAMGVPYDVSLAGRHLSQPFSPFVRRVVRGRRLDRGA